MTDSAPRILALPRRVLAILSLLPLLALMAACDTPMEASTSPSIRVERTHSLPANPPPTAFVINALTRGQSADPAFRTAANVVGALLEEEGHAWLNQDKAHQAPWKVTLETYVTPRVDVAAPGAVVRPNVTYGLGWGGSGGLSSDAGLGLSISTSDPTRDSLVEKRLTLTIRDNGRTVYQGRAVLYDKDRDLTASVVPLARALFRDFPGPQGTSLPEARPTNSTFRE